VSLAKLVVGNISVVPPKAPGLSQPLRALNLFFAGYVKRLQTVCAAPAHYHSRIAPVISVWK
jgi:hypothetical protein